VFVAVFGVVVSTAVMSAATPAQAAPSCTITTELQRGVNSADVACLETRLQELGFLASRAVDTNFDKSTLYAVQKYQRMRHLKSTGKVDVTTATHLQLWAGSVLVAPAAGGSCTPTGRSAVVDPAWQRFWLCQDGAMVSGPYGTTTASTSYYTKSQGPGSYKIFGKMPRATFRYSDGRRVYMRWMIQYDYSIIKSHLGFHSVPTTKPNGSVYVQPLSSVGDVSMRNASGGCLRLLPDLAKTVYDFLQIGDTVVVTSL